jgi:uncharacterized protein involved in exopolysaccharide biosynthesis
MSAEHTQNPSHQDVSVDEEVDFVAFWHVLVKYKRLIFKVTLVATLVAAIGSFLIPNTYVGQVTLAAVHDDSKSPLTGALGGLGGLVAMTGLSLGGGSIDENLAVLKSREFLWRFVQEKKIMPILFKPNWFKDLLYEWSIMDRPGQWHVYRLLVEDNKLGVFSDKDTGIVIVGIEWKDPVLAAQWANELVESLNKYLAKQSIERSEANLKYLREELKRTEVEEMRRTLFDLISQEQKNAMLAKTQKDFAFKVLDPAAEADRKSGPKRVLIVLLAMFLAGVSTATYAVVKEKQSKDTDDSKN